MLAFPNCKINLGLSITEKREDGYHNLETVFYPIPLFDVLEIIKAIDGNTDFNSNGIEIPGNRSHNLCLKAYELILNNYKIEPVKIFLQKNIPIGAGLGGGSSDAAFTLLLLNDLFELNLSESTLINYASVLGADCSFFIKNKPTYAFGIGNEFSELNLDLNGYFIVLIKPEIHIGTSEAYAGINPTVKAKPLKKYIDEPFEIWKSSLVNDFEKTIFKNHPQIEKIRNTLYNKGAIYASMSGSGSSVFGLFENEIDLEKEFYSCFYWSSFLK